MKATYEKEHNKERNVWNVHRYLHEEGTKKPPTKQPLAACIDETAADNLIAAYQFNITAAAKRQTPAQEAELYWEEIGSLVDGIISDIQSGHITSKNHAAERMEEAAHDSNYCHLDTLAIVCLKFSKHPTAYFFEHERVVDDKAKVKRLGGFEAIDFNAGKDQFPWGKLASEAIEADCKEDLFQHEEFKALPQYGDEDEGAVAEGEAAEVD